MEAPAVGHLLMIASRLLEMWGFLLVLLMVFKGIALRFILMVAGTTLTAMTTAVYSFFTGKVPVMASFGVDLIGAFLVSGITYYAFLHKRKSRLKAPPMPKNERCPVCTAFVRETDQYVVAREGQDLFYFDSREHFKKFMENFEDYKSLRKLHLLRVEDVYDKDLDRWMSVSELLNLPSDKNP